MQLIDRNELFKHYEHRLRPELESMEASRVDVRNRLILLIISATPFVLYQIDCFFNLKIIDPTSYGISEYVLIVPSIIAIIASFMFFHVAYGPYKEAYKENVSAEVFKLIAPTMSYQYDGYISSQYYLGSKLFRKHVHRYSGDDYLQGKMGDVDFRFSELHTEYKTTTRDKNGKTKEHWHTIFKGIFIATEYNKNIIGETYVLPDRAERFFGRLGAFFQKKKLTKHAKELIKLENPTFEREFLVYGHDQIESRYVLTPKIMEAFLEIKKNFNRPLYASFIGNRVYIAISMRKNMFEPTIFTTGVNYKNIEKMAYLLSASIDIVKQLELNQDIWNKSA